MTVTGSPAEWVWLARIRRPQGRKGEVFADLLTDFPEKFANRRQLWLIPVREGDPTGAPGLGSETGETVSPQPKSSAPGPSHWGTRDTKSADPQIRPVELTNHWFHKGGIVFHFGGIDSISSAETLKGLIVAIPRSERTELHGDDTYLSDLTGCTLVDVAGREPLSLGTIDEVDRTAGPAPLLVIHSPRGEILVPFAKTYLRRIDLDAKRIEMALPEGLADLNSSAKPR